MNENSASLTSLATSVMRALHTRLDQPALIDDTWGDRLVLDAEREALRSTVLTRASPEAREALETLSTEEVLAIGMRRSPMYGTVILRMRVAEDALAAAVARGVRQYVIVGAGMDSFGLRHPAFAEEVDVIEVDHPATQRFKRDRLRDCGVEIPERLHFVAADLSTESLDAALARSPFRSDVPAFFSWLGVTTYLTREANMATLAAIARCSAPASELVFTYMDERELNPSTATTTVGRDVGAIVASMGEPWTSGFDPATLPGLLCSAGLTLLDDLTGDGLRARYHLDPDGALQPGPNGHVARARVTPLQR